MLWEIIWIIQEFLLFFVGQWVSHHIVKLKLFDFISPFSESWLIKETCTQPMSCVWCQGTWGNLIWCVFFSIKLNRVAQFRSMPMCLSVSTLFTPVDFPFPVRRSFTRGPRSFSSTVRPVPKRLSSSPLCVSCLYNKPRSIASNSSSVAAEKEERDNKVSRVHYTLW